ncbi:AGAP003646-PA [Anopheles gambiae str. PEST]|uniref:AGAP003646-PA n=1 Tax=Anopheles gambiae TaxID=7165 RepID=A0NDJ9_ANOGA|nr:AGAP003646-PA [Anopheles gambiae str. PEST]
MLTRSDAIRVDRDYRYTGEDAHSFVRCCLCRCYTPFIFYVVSKKALDVIANTLPQSHNFFCVNCLPKSSSATTLYRDRCLFNSDEYLSMFRGYEYYNPYYGVYYNTPRLILTENIRIHPDYKKIVRKPQPALVKMRKLFGVFPAVHQIPFRKHASMVEMYSELRKKYREIRSTYTDTSINQTFMDTYCITVERTPSVYQSVRERTHRVREGEGGGTALFPSDTMLMRTVSTQESAEPSTSESDMGDVSSLQISSQSYGDDERENRLAALASQQSEARSIVSAQGGQQSSGSFNISSQDVELERDPEFELPESIGSLLSNQSVRSIDSSLRLDHLVTRRRIHDSQEAGPSGLQQLQKQPPGKATTPEPKRRRISTATPMNPSPAEAQTTRDVNVRLPRLPGG